jgi:hypothetical protein
MLVLPSINAFSRRSSRSCDNVFRNCRERSTRLLFLFFGGRKLAIREIALNPDKPVRIVFTLPVLNVALSQEFERTFEQNYGRKMTDEEQRILKAAREIIQQKLGAYSERAA